MKRANLGHGSYGQERPSMYVTIGGKVEKPVTFGTCFTLRREAEGAVLISRGIKLQLGHLFSFHPAPRDCF